MRYRWTILATGSTGQAAASAVTIGLPALAPALRTSYGLSLAQIGLVLAAVGAGMALTLLPWGMLADRVGERPVLAGGLAGTGAVLAVAAYADSRAALTTCVFAAGACAASASAASGRAVMGWFAPAQRGLALGLRQTAIPLGGAAAAVSLPAVVSRSGLPAALLVLAGVCVLAGIAAALWLRDPPRAHDDVVTRAAAPLRDEGVWRVATGSALIVTAQISVLGFVVLFLNEERGFSPAAAAGVLAAVNVGGAAVRVLAGHWSDRLGERIRPLRRLAFALTVALALTAALVDAPAAALLPALVCAGVLSLSWNGLSFAAAAELAGRARSGAALGLQQTSLSVAAALTSVVFAALVARTSWQLGFALFALTPVLGAALLPSSKAERAARREEEAARPEASGAPAAAHEQG